MTIRKEIIELLRTGEWTAQDLSRTIRIPQKEVYVHLEHVQRSLKGNFKITPSQCLACGFTFTKRSAIRSPSRCPLCKSEHIREPHFFCTNSDRKNNVGDRK